MPSSRFFTTPHRAGKTFFTDRKTQDAVVRNLEIVGEATKRLSQTLKDAHSDIAWRPIAGMRDKLIHEYFGINLHLVWDVVERDLPSLQRKLAQLLGFFGEEVSIPTLNLLNPQLLRQSHFRFVNNFFQAGKTGEGESIHGNSTDFADR